MSPNVVISARICQKGVFNSILVLTRKSGEEIRIGEEIIVTVLLTGGNRGKLGIRGPRGIPVLQAVLSLKAPPLAGRRGRSVRSLESGSVS